MITGDKKETAEAIARETGIDHVIAGVLPDGKVAALDNLRAGGYAKSPSWATASTTLPALAYADVGIAIGTGTDVAIESADAVLMSGDLRGVVNAVEVSKRTMSAHPAEPRLGVWIQCGVDPGGRGRALPGIRVALVAGLAAGAMALSSVSVLTNAPRLRRIAPAMTERRSAERHVPQTRTQPAE